MLHLGDCSGKAVLGEVCNESQGYIKGLTCSPEDRQTISTRDLLFLLLW